MRISTISYSKAIVLAILLGISPVCLAEYVDLDPPFIVNLADDSGIKFIQVSVQVRVANGEAAKALTTHNPAIRDAMIMLISTKTTQQMNSRQGKEALRKEALEAIRKALATQHVVFTQVAEEKKDSDSSEKKEADKETKTAAASNSPIQDVYFTRFIIQ